MQLLAVFSVLVVSVLPSVLTTVDMFCGCSVEHHKDWKFALHCNRDQAGNTGVSCQKAQVLEIPQGYYYVPGYALIRLYRTHKTFEEAKKVCEEEGARLAIPPDQHAFDGLRQIFPKVKGIVYAFLGISDQITEGVYVGVDGHPAPYLPWQPNEPNHAFGSIERCVEIRNDGTINDVKCSIHLAFFCERRLSVSVPDSYTWLEDAGRFYKVHNEKRTHAEAAKTCRAENAALAVPDTWRRALALLQLLDVNVENYIIGFTDEAVEGDFVTETGRHLKDMEFIVWRTNEPNNNSLKGKPEHCLVLSGLGNYNDVDCSSEYSFICEIVPK